MRISNTMGLPPVVVAAVSKMSSKYSKGGADYSVTELLQPAHYHFLKQKHAGDIIEDIVDLLYRIDGQADHMVLENAETPEGLTEERLTCSIDGKRISGAIDFYEDGIIYDLKRTSVWSIIYGDKIEWEQQLNCYGYLYRKAGFPVKELKIICRFRDWSKSKSKYDASYPSLPIMLIDIKVWSDEEVETFIRERMAALESADGSEPCSPGERWAKPTKYAVTKTGRKSAVRVLDTEAEANELIAAGKGDGIEVREGGDGRCIDYCPVNVFCPYFIDTYVNQLDIAESERRDKIAKEVF